MFLAKEKPRLYPLRRHRRRSANPSQPAQGLHIRRALIRGAADLRRGGSETSIRRRPRGGRPLPSLTLSSDELMISRAETGLGPAQKTRLKTK